MQLQGQLQTIPLAELVQIIGTGRKSGTLELRGDAQTVRLVFRDGGLAGVLDERDDERLAELLVERALLDRLELDALLEIASKRRQPLDETLRQTGLLREDDLGPLFEECILRSFSALMEWRHGDFDFRPPRDDELLAEIRAIPVDRLLLRAIA